MNILALNAGSTSLRFEVIAETSDCHNWGHKYLSGMIQGIGEKACFKLLGQANVIKTQAIAASDYAEAALWAFSWLQEHLETYGETYGIGFGQIDAIAHRVVHGGCQFETPVQITESTLRTIKQLAPLAPQHNPPAIAIVKAAQSFFSNDIPTVAVFDTSFHRSLPDVARYYPLAWPLTQHYKIERYGFHGISHQYLSRRYQQITHTPTVELNLITLHLESGCSITAIRQGQSVDTSMGFTPLEGLMMGSRCGDIDPAIVAFLARQERKTIEEIEQSLNQSSGLLGVSQLSHDTRELVKVVKTNDQVRLALEMFCYRICKYIGAYLATLNGAKAIVLGGGISENTPWIRERICQHLSWLGLTMDKERNKDVIDREGLITTEDSRLAAYVIPTEEGLMISKEAYRCLT